MFCRQKTAEDDNAKINVFPIIPCTFLLFKASAFLQIFSSRNFLFLYSKCWKTSNKRTRIPLFIKQIVSLIELKMQRLINYWTNTCKFKIDKKHTQWGSLEQSMTLVKINSWKGFIVSLIYHLNFVKKIKCKLETAFDLSFNIALIWLHITGNTALYMNLVHCN